MNTGSNIYREAIARAGRHLSGIDRLAAEKPGLLAGAELRLAEFRRSDNCTPEMLEASRRMRELETFVGTDEAEARRG